MPLHDLRMCKAPRQRTCRRQETGCGVRAWHGLRTKRKNAREPSCRGAAQACLRQAVGELRTYQTRSGATTPDAGLSNITSPNKRAAGTGGPEVTGIVIAYSAATFRGGSSAPESWISATW